MLEGHPYNPPMVFVKPTATMQIKAGKHVDHSGRVFLPYLHEWKHVSTLKPLVDDNGDYENNNDDKDDIDTSNNNDKINNNQL